jgi:hypothetical protein
MIKCLEKHKHLIFLKRERWLRSKFLFELQKCKLGCYKFEKLTKEVNILIKKAKHIRRYNYTTEQNLEPIEGVLEGFQECLVAYEEATKRANNPDGA